MWPNCAISEGAELLPKTEEWLPPLWQHEARAAIRIPGNITKEKLDLLRAVDAVYLDEIRKAGLYDAIWQAFAVLLPVRTVGVMGDGWTYDQACALRAVTSTDGMTADYYPFEHAFLERVAARIINEVRGINRVTYDITSKPPGTIEWSEEECDRVDWNTVGYIRELLAPDSGR